MSDKNKKLIIDLIQQDLKYCQLVDDLKQLGLQESKGYHLETIYRLMHIDTEKKTDYLLETYTTFMSMATDCTTTTDTESLRSLAKDCYYRLKYLIEL